MPWERARESSRHRGSREDRHPAGRRPRARATGGLVQIDACGICGTDIHILDGESPLARYPLIPGHEFSGEVLAVGGDVEDLQIGDLVAVDPNLYCGECSFCQAGRDNLCQKYDAIGVTRAGACAELVTAPAANAFRLPADLPRAWGALVEPLSCAVHGFDRLEARLADHYLIYGAGPWGCSWPSSPAAPVPPR